MNRRWRGPTAYALLVLSVLAASSAEAALFAPNAPPREPALSPTEIQPDPVISAIDVIGQPSAVPRITAMPEIANAPRMSGGDGGAEAIFPGGTASMIGGTRFLEGVTDARDPLQLLPPEPSVAQRIPAPAAAGLLLGALGALAVLRRRTGRRLAT